MGEAVGGDVTTPPVGQRRDVRTAKAGLEVEGVVVRFGGVVAVDGVDMRAPIGSITGLMGPNGAGKTTTFNVCTGLQAPTSGTVLLRGQDMTRSDTASRARAGIGRTFQQTRLFASMTVRENVELGREAGQAGAHPLRHCLRSRAEVAEMRRATDEAIERCGIGELADLRAGALSTGQRRLVELARTLSGDFELILLDEPSAGLDLDESLQFGEILRAVVADRGIGLFLVEHDVELVMSLCEHIYVLDFGRLLFDGTPAEVTSSASVRAAYLGAGR